MAESSVISFRFAVFLIIGEPAAHDNWYMALHQAVISNDWLSGRNYLKRTVQGSTVVQCFALLPR